MGSWLMLLVVLSYVCNSWLCCGTTTSCHKHSVVKILVIDTPEEALERKI